MKNEDNKECVSECDAGWYKNDSYTPKRCKECSDSTLKSCS